MPTNNVSSGTSFILKIYLSISLSLLIRLCTIYIASGVLVDADYSFAVLLCVFYNVNLVMFTNII